MLVDTHCHLNFKEFQGEVEPVLQRARKADVLRLINIGTNLKTSVESVTLADRYPEVHASVGIHPHEANSLDIGAMQELYVLARKPKVVAIGEIGLDYFRLEHAGKFTKSPSKEQQRTVFEQLLDLAIELELPVVIHSRDAAKDVYEILQSFRDRVRGVLHAFSYDWEWGKRFLDLGLFVSFAGNLTYPKNTHLHEVAKIMPIDRLLLETDSPYLPPERFRGKRNEPAYMVEATEYISQLRGLDRAVVERQTTANARSLFRL